MKKDQGRSFIHQITPKLAALWPHFCCFCHSKTNLRRDLCAYCEIHMPTLTMAQSEGNMTLCLRCGAEWPSDVEIHECASCVNYATVYERICCAYRYSFPVDAMVQQLKYQRKLSFGRLLGSLLAEKVAASVQSEELPDVVVPVPVHKNRYATRGFNQAEIIAQWCARSLNVPMKASWVSREVDTEALSAQNRAQRSLHIRGAFRANEKLAGRRVAIVDDVLTTGATAGELATELLDTGASSIQLWTVARTPESHAMSAEAADVTAGSAGAVGRVDGVNTGAGANVGVEPRVDRQ